MADKEKQKSLMQLQAEEHALLNKLYNQDGVFDVEDEETARNLEIEIHGKINTYAMMIKNKSIDFEIQKLQDQIDLRQSIINSWKNFKKFATVKLFEFAGKSTNGYFPVMDAKYNTESTELYMYPEETVSNTVDVTKVEEKYLKFTLPKLGYEDYHFLLGQLRKTKKGKELAKHIVDNIKYNAGVTDLPEGHKALVPSVNRKVVFLKNIKKPKLTEGKKKK